jgi:hypothetical protein
MAYLDVRYGECGRPTGSGCVRRCEGRDVKQRDEEGGNEEMRASGREARKNNGAPNLA